jgi:hypothetical protein
MIRMEAYKELAAKFPSQSGPNATAGYFGGLTSISDFLSKLLRHRSPTPRATVSRLTVLVVGNNKEVVIAYNAINNSLQKKPL